MIHSLAQLRPGLVVSQAVRDSRGQILLPVGAVLTESSISQLGIRGVQVVDVDVQESPEDRAIRIDRELSRIDALIPSSQENPQLVQIRRVLLEVLDG